MDLLDPLTNAITFTQDYRLIFIVINYVSKLFLMNILNFVLPLIKALLLLILFIWVVAYIPLKRLLSKNILDLIR